MAKNVFVAYFLWFPFGIFGLHHFYLGRDRQAFLWFVTFGGFVYGWCCDFWKISHYVDEANGHPQCEHDHAIRFRRYKQPPFSVKRCLAQLLLGSSWGYLILAALPSPPPAFLTVHQLQLLLHLLVPLLVALGVHTVGNAGSRCRGPLRWPLAAAGAASLLLGPHAVRLIALAATVSFELLSKRWRTGADRQRPRRLCSRVLILLVSVSVFYLMWGSYLYYNAVIVQNNGEKVRFRDAVTNFFNSQLWKRMQEEIVRLLRLTMARGWRHGVSAFLDSWDPSGERAALQLLGLPSNATQRDITSRYRQLSRQHHPDRYRDPTEKRQAETLFTDINGAYDKLSSIRRARRRSSQSAPTEEPEDKTRDEL